MKKIKGDRIYRRQKIQIKGGIIRDIEGDRQKKRQIMQQVQLSQYALP